MILGQVQGEYEARTRQIVEYLARRQEIGEVFRKIIIVQVPREHNGRVDQLARMGLDPTRTCSQKSPGSNGHTH